MVVELLKNLDRANFDQVLVTGPQTGREGSLLDEVKKLNVKTILIPELVRQIDPKKDAVAFFKLYSLFFTDKPSVVHFHTYKAGVVGCIAAKLAGVRKIIFSPHGHIFADNAKIPGVPRKKIVKSMLYHLTRISQRCANRVIAVSEEDRNDQVRLNLAPISKYAVVYNGVRPVLKSENFGFNGRPVIGTIGRLSEEKGHRVLIEAFDEIRKEFPTSTLVIVGDGELREELQNIAAGKNIVFTGLVESEKIISSFDVYVQSSHYESQGLSIIEAMLAGKPVVASRVGGIQSVIKDGENGILVPPNDPVSLAKAVADVIRDKEKGLEFSKRAQIMAAELFSIDRMVRKHEKIYREA